MAEQIPLVNDWPELDTRGHRIPGDRYTSRDFLAREWEGSIRSHFVCKYRRWAFLPDGTLNFAPDREDFPEGNPCEHIRLQELASQLRYWDIDPAQYGRFPQHGSAARLHPASS